MAVKPIPEGFHSVTPYLTVEGADKLMQFLTTAFGAKQVFRMDGPDGKVRHAEMRIGDSVVMIAEARENWKPMPGTLYLYVEDVDATYKKAVQAGAKSVMEVATQFYGDRSGGVQDGCGNYWWIATHVEDVPEDEIARRAAAMSK